MPSRANAEPSYSATDPEPFMNEPPWTQTSTGRPGVAGSGAHTVRFRHSSPGITTSGNTGWYCGGESPLGTVEPYAVPSRTPDQGVTGCGGRIRFGPNGGAADGTPRNAATPPSARPRTAPSPSWTTGCRAASFMAPSCPSGRGAPQSAHARPQRAGPEGAGEPGPS